MPQSKGFVAHVTGDGSAEVVIQTEHTECIPGAPDIDLCHQCTGCSSELTIKALNRAGAALGDLVYVSHNPGKVMKNAFSLLGIPLIGLMLGMATGVSLYQRAAVHETGAFIFAAVGILLGMIVGVRAYKRGAADNQPMITQVIKSAIGATSPPTVDPVCNMELSTSTASARLTYQGVTYYFCHPGCLKAFTEDPARYVEQSRGPHETSPL